MINSNYNYQFKVAGCKQLATLINLCPFKFDKLEFDYRFTITINGDHLCLLFKILKQRDIKLGYVLDCLSFSSRVRMGNLFVEYETTLPFAKDEYFEKYVQKQ